MTDKCPSRFRRRLAHPSTARTTSAAPPKKATHRRQPNGMAQGAAPSRGDGVLGDVERVGVHAFLRRWTRTSPIPRRQAVRFPCLRAVTRRFQIPYPSLP